MESVQSLTQSIGGLSAAGLIALVAVVALAVAYKALDVVGKSKGGRGK